MYSSPLVTITLLSAGSSCRARSRALDSSDCENSDRSAETGADTDGWVAGGGATRVAGSCAEASGAGSSRAADGRSTLPGASDCELHRYATMAAVATVTTT